MSNTILLVEDDEIISTIISNKLEKRNHVVIKVYKGDAVKRNIIRHAPCAVILDIDLPNMNGDEVFKEIRSFYQGIVVFLTSKDSSDLELYCLRLGADDYIEKNKPFDVFYQRLIRLLTSRHKAPSSTLPIQVGLLFIDKQTFVCKYLNKTIKLSSDELDLLSFMAINKNELITRDTLFSTLKGYPYDGVSRSVDIGISRLRDKLIQAGISKSVISGVRGKGYTFNEQFLSPNNNYID
jgi:DNA-binding response OmpR family regulator